MDTHLANLVAARLPAASSSKTLLLQGWNQAEIAAFRAAGIRVASSFEEESVYDFAAIMCGNDAQLAEDDETASGRTFDLDLLERLRDSIAAKGAIWLIVRGGDGSKLPRSGERATRRLVAAASGAGLSIVTDQTVTTGIADQLPARIFDCRPDANRIRAYRKGDEDQILTLFADCFQLPRSIEHWHWKYTQNPWLNRHISLAWDNSESLLAHYAGFGLPLWDRGHESLALQMGDTMTDPRARALGTRQGSLLARTVRHFFAAFREPEIDLFFGFNTGPIQRFCRWFIGGGQVDVVNYWRSDRKPPGPPQAGYRVDEDPVLDASFDRLFGRAAKHYAFLIRRDALYLDWRYRRCPDIDYRILSAKRFGRLVGWSVFRQVGDRLVWGDAFFLRRHAAAASRAILDAALDAFDCEQTEAWFSSSPSWWTSLLAPLGFALRPEPQGLSLMALDNSRELDLASLYYTMGDGDLF